MIWAQLITKFDSRGFDSFATFRSPKSFEDSLEYISDVLGATGVGDGDGFFNSASSSFIASSRFVSRSITEQTKIH